VSDAPFIDRTKPSSPGLDYVALRQRGLEIIQQLAGRVWTDYNEHDPGVTTLEQLCYALTELSYRAELPIEDLLVDPETNKIDAARQALLAPEAILPCNPLTENDYRKLIVDRVPVVGNAWLRAREVSHPGDVNGLYDVDLYVPRAAPHAAQDVVQQVRRAYAAARGLCEDLDEVRILEPVPTTLTTRVSIAPSARPDSVAAHILYRVSCLLAPELRRRSLDAMLAEGQTPAAILAGPLPERGFVSDDGLEPRRDRFTIGDITRVLREVPGVTGVHSVGVVTGIGSMGTNGGAPAIVVPPAGILVLNTDAVDGTYGIRLVQENIECRPSPDAVRRELDRLWADHRRQYDTRAECKRLLSFPTGAAVDLKSYDLLQHQFPGVYGINEHGVRSDSTDQRRAQARQLKAFLLVFEQLLADAFARLASITRGASSDPVYQHLDAAFPELLPLFTPSYRSGVRTMESPERTADRLWRMRRSMLAMYAETAEPIVTPASPESAGGGWSLDAARVHGQLGFLRHLPQIGARRGTGFDYSAPPTRDNASGLEIRTRLQLGLRAETPRPLEETLRRFGLSDMQDAPPVSHRALMMKHARHIEQHFKPVPPLLERPAAATEPQRNELSEELLVAAAGPDPYRIGELRGEPRTWAVVCRAPSQPLWQLAGMYEEESDALAGAAALRRCARAIHRQVRRLYVVEHSLLRFAPHDADADFEGSFTVSAVVCVPVREAIDPTYRADVCRILRSNTPAHVVVRGCFVRFSRIGAFEALYLRWRDALRHREGREEACRKLRDFLRADLP
jgi:hypothetical protein